MNDGILESSSVEKTRIRAVYGKLEVNDQRYSWFNPGHQFIAQQRERRLLDLLRRYGFAALQSKSILEVGCGTGRIRRRTFDQMATRSPGCPSSVGWTIACCRTTNTEHGA